MENNAVMIAYGEPASWTCQAHACELPATHGGMLDDRWDHQTTPGTPEFKPLELLLGCENHIRGIIRRCVLTFADRLSDYLITDDLRLKWLNQVTNNEARIHEKFKH